MLFPLWAKLGLLFGLSIGASIAAWGSLDLEADLADNRERIEKEMQTVALALAAGIDGDSFDSFTREDDRDRPSFQTVVRQLDSVVRNTTSVSWAGACRRDDKGRWVWVVEHTNENAYPVGFPIFDAEAARNRAGEGEVVYEPAVEDDTGRWRTVWAPIRSSSGAVVGLVEVVADADRDVLIAAQRRRRVALQVALAVTLSVLASFVVGRALAGNLDKLVQAARRVAQGDLETRVDLQSMDELGVLAASFNLMVEGLQEREFIRDTFGRFVNPEVVAGILQDRDLSLGGEAREVTVLMSDLRGFTALSGELGPERMVALLNRYLSRMTEVVVAHGGNVAELLGDGMVVLFGAPVPHDDDPERATRCALAMLEALRAFNASEGQDLEMGIGVDTGVVIAGNIGSPQHMKYGVVGEAINLAARLEAYTVGNQVLVSAATAERVPAAELGEVIEFQPKGRKQLVRCYPVRSLGELRAPDTEESPRPVRLTGRLWRLQGKTVEPDSVEVVVVGLGLHTVVIDGAELALRDKVKLELVLPDQVLSDVYATVEALAPTRLHLSGLGAEELKAIGALLEAT